jgi:hypothetical protein
LQPQPHGTAKPIKYEGFSSLNLGSISRPCNG